jgi:CheY-like chemotaxis protein
LLDNALKFTPAGTVEFGASLQGNQICYFVKDTGIGIAREQQEFVFGRFNQENITLTREHEGSGLGLAITKGLVELMQGAISLESEKGKGSLFRIELPLRFLAGRNEGFGQEMSGSQESTGYIKGPILVAEDDEVNYQLIYSILRTVTSDQIIRAVNGTEALDAMVHNPHVELVLMDIKMPGMDGFEAIRRIRTLNSRVPVVVVSAFANGMEEQTAYEAGCNGFISKPYNPTTVIGKINKIVAGSQSLL